MSVYLPDPKRYEAIQYARCGRSGLRLPRLSLGLWHNFGGVDPVENQRALLRRSFDLGITHFDLANNYGPPPGTAEENFGRILRMDFAAHRDSGRDEYCPNSCTLYALKQEGLSRKDS